MRENTYYLTMPEHINHARTQTAPLTCMGACAGLPHREESNSLYRRWWKPEQTGTWRQPSRWIVGMLWQEKVDPLNLSWPRQQERGVCLQEGAVNVVTWRKKAKQCPRSWQQPWTKGRIHAQKVSYYSTPDCRVSPIHTHIENSAA